jgi:peptide/nickel transport system substrate-binding protein
VPAASQFYNEAAMLQPRDVAKAKSILAAAGYDKPVTFELLVPNRPLVVRVAEMMQAMVSEAGFDLKLKVVDFATTLNMTDAGDFQAWGPIGAQFANDPDAVTYMSLHSTGSRNVGKYSNPEMDKIMDATRTELDPAKRRDLFRQAAELIVKDNTVIYLYHQRPLFAASAKLKDIGFTGDGFVLFSGINSK